MKGVGSMSRAILRGGRVLRGGTSVISAEEREVVERGVVWDGVKADVRVREAVRAAAVRRFIVDLF